jgi:hypothetical protein
LGNGWGSPAVAKSARSARTCHCGASNLRKIGEFGSTYLTRKVDTSFGTCLSVYQRRVSSGLRTPPTISHLLPRTESMSKPSLSLFRPQDASHVADQVSGRTQRELDRISGTADPKTVMLPLGKLVPLLIDAVEHERAWIQDFAEDPVHIDADLYDVLLAYQKLRERAA